MIGSSLTPLGTLGRGKKGVLRQRLRGASTYEEWKVSPICGIPPISLTVYQEIAKELDDVSL
jgi:hypothetical protein